MDLYEAIEIICDDYCKYPDIESGNKLADICDKCPMNNCEDLRWADRKTKQAERGGEWIERIGGISKELFYQCSKCYGEVDTNEFDCCPWCGAKMKGAEE